MRTATKRRAGPEAAAAPGGPRAGARPAGARETAQGAQLAVQAAVQVAQLAVQVAQLAVQEAQLAVQEAQLAVQVARALRQRRAPTVTMGRRRALTGQARRPRPRPHRRPPEGGWSGATCAPNEPGAGCSADHGEIRSPRRAGRGRRRPALPAPGPRSPRHGSRRAARRGSTGRLASRRRRRSRCRGARWGPRALAGRPLRGGAKPRPARSPCATDRRSRSRSAPKAPVPTPRLPLSSPVPWLGQTARPRHS